MEARATEIEQGLLQSFEFSATQRFAVHEVARYMAILEAIDRDLDDRGLVDKRRGEPRSIVNLRSSTSRQLDRWLSKISPTIDRQTSDGPRQPAGHADYIRELRRIVNDPSTSARDRLGAISKLMELDSGSSGVTQVTMNFFRDEDGNPTLRPAWLEAVDDSGTSEVRRQTPMQSTRRSSRSGLSSGSVSGLDRLRERGRQHAISSRLIVDAHELCVTAFCDARTAVPEETCDNLESKPEVDEM